MFVCGVRLDEDARIIFVQMTNKRECSLERGQVSELTRNERRCAEEPIFRKCARRPFVLSKRAAVKMQNYCRCQMSDAVVISFSVTSSPISGMLLGSLLSAGFSNNNKLARAADDRDRRTFTNHMSPDWYHLSLWCQDIISPRHFADDLRRVRNPCDSHKD